eukprot:m.64408 g.64408  ORF g.64408 m.64408 type:complete len:285 (+) comp17878_c1_seq1:30-884(+)
MADRQMKKLTFGFVGCGTISTAIVRGLCRQRAGAGPAAPTAGDESNVVEWPLRVSQRNEVKTAALLAEFGPGKVVICATNDEVATGCDVVVIGLTPKVALAILPTLKLRSDQLILNLVSTVTNERVRELVGIPDITVVKSVPLPPVALHAGVSVLYPRHPEMVALFEVLGKVICVDTEDHLRVLQAGSGMMGPFYKTVLTMQEWMKAQGIADADAAVFAGGFYQCVSADSAEQTSGEGLAHLIAEQTPGGLNEEAIRRHSEAGCYDGERAALDATLARLTKAAL